jgi:hypothetical protein
MPDDPLLTVDEVAKILSGHPDTVRRWIRSGEPMQLIWGGPLVTGSIVLNWFASYVIASPAPILSN